MNHSEGIRWSLLLRNQVLVVILAMLALVPVLFSGSIFERDQQLLAYGVLGLVLLAVFLFQISTQVSWREAGRLALAGPNLPILLYLAWTFWSASHSIEPYLSRLQLIQLSGGIVLYAAVALQVRRREEFGAVLGCAAAIALGSVVAALVMGPGPSGGLHGTFHDQQLFGAFLLLVFPIVLGLGVGAAHPNARLAARALAVLMAAGLLMSSCRSSCIGAVVALVVFAGLSLAYTIRPTGLRGRKHELVVIPVLALVLVSLFVALSGAGSGIGQRFSTLLHVQQDQSLEDRQALWGVARKVIAARPVAGWGPGSYAIAQIPFNPKSRPEIEIRMTGPSLLESPHNSYLNLAAEVGVVGLALYLLVIGTFLYAGVRAVGRIRSPLRQYALIGCLAAVCGEVVDGFGNPGWMYPEVSTFFWLVLGIGMCAAGLSGLPDSEDEGTPEHSTRRRSRRSHRLASDLAN